MDSRRRMTLEQAIACIQDDELVEVTKVIRIRQRWLDPHERKRQGEEVGGDWFLAVKKVVCTLRASRPATKSRCASNCCRRECANTVLVA